MLTNEDLARDKATCELRTTTDPEFAGFYTRIMSAIDELLTLREAVAPQMAEVDEMVRQIKSYPHVNSYEGAMKLASMLRTVILTCEREKQRANEADEARKKVLEFARKEILELRNDVGKEIATLTAERDEARGLLKWLCINTNIRLALEWCGSSPEIKRILEIVEEK